MPGWLWPLSRRRAIHPGFPPHTRLDTLRYVVLDTELTSLDRRSNRLLSVGAIAMDGAKIRLSEQFYSVVNPGVPVPAPGVPIHRLRPSDIEKARAPGVALDEFQAFIGGAVLVGHFVGIDLKALEKELTPSGRTLANPAIDTARVHRWVLRHRTYTEDLPIQLDNVDLITLAKLYQIEFHQAHDALDDAFLTARLWQKLIHILGEMKIECFRDLMRIGRG